MILSATLVAFPGVCGRQPSKLFFVLYTLYRLVLGDMNIFIIYRSSFAFSFVITDAIQNGGGLFKCWEAEFGLGMGWPKNTEQRTGSPPAGASSAGSTPERARLSHRKSTARRSGHLNLLIRARLPLLLPAPFCLPATVLFLECPPSPASDAVNVLFVSPYVYLRDTVRSGKRLLHFTYYYTRLSDYKCRLLSLSHFSTIAISWIM